MAAAFVGDQVGYWFGKKVGPSLFDRPKSRLFDPKNVLKAHVFFEKYGTKTIVLARFVPIVRTFAPVVAGVGTMRYRTFVIYNIIGAAAVGPSASRPSATSSARSTSSRTTSRSPSWRSSPSRSSR